MISGIFEILCFSIKKAESLLQLDVLLCPEKKRQIGQAARPFSNNEVPKKEEKEGCVIDVYCRVWLGSLSRHLRKIPGTFLIV